MFKSLILIEIKYITKIYKLIPIYIVNKRNNIVNNFFKNGFKKLFFLSLFKSYILYIVLSILKKFLK